MSDFVPRAKMNKRLRKKLDAQRRTLWAVNPVTKKTESAKVYNRKKRSRYLDDNFDSGIFFICCGAITARRFLSAAVPPHAPSFR